MIAIVTRMSRFGGRVRRVSRIRTIDVAPTVEGIRDLIDTGEPLTLVVIGEDVPLADALDITGVVQDSRPAPVVLARYQPDLAEQAATAAGISEVLPVDLSESAARLLVDRYTDSANRSDSLTDPDPGADVAPDSNESELVAGGESEDSSTPDEQDFASMLAWERPADSEPELSDAPSGLSSETQRAPFDPKPDAEVSESAPALRLVGLDEVTGTPGDPLAADDEQEDVLAALLQQADADEATRNSAGPRRTDPSAPAKLVGLDSMLEPPVIAVQPDPFTAEHRVVVVFSPKGGVGKTTVCTNLAVALAQRQPHQAVLVDLDVQFGDVTSALGLSPSHTVDAAFTPDGVQQPLVVKGLLNTYRDGLFVLCGPDSPAAMEHVRPEQVGQLLSQLRDDYGYVIVDTGAGLSETTLAALEIATDIVVVVSLDVSAIRSTRRALDVLRKLQLMPPSLHVVVNLADPGAGLTEQDVAIALDAEVDGSVPRSTDVALSMNIGEPLSVHRKSTPLARAVADVAAKIVGEHVPESNRGLFKKLSGR